MNEFRRLAAKIDQHMQQLAAQGVSEPHAIINRMMGYMPDLHKIWVGWFEQLVEALPLFGQGIWIAAVAFPLRGGQEADRHGVTAPRRRRWPA